MSEPTTHHHKSKLLLGLSIVILLATLLYSAYSISYVREILHLTNNEDLKQEPQELITIPDHRIRNRESTEKLSPSEYLSEENYYLAILDLKDPGESLAELRQNVEDDQALLRSCHAITHTLGQKAFEKYQDFDKALVYLDEVCNTGYMHGVIEAKFSESTDIDKDLLTICEGHDQGRCYHGVGHGVMFYTKNELPKSLSMCEKFVLKSQLYCVEGVFMENYNTDQKLHPSTYVSDSDYFYPCATQKVKFKYSCYYYAPLRYLSINYTNYQQAFDWCNTAEAEFVMHCVRGVAAIAIKQNISNPKLVEAACMTAEAKQIPYCIDGMVGLYLNHYNSLEKAYQLCDALLPTNQKACRAGVESRSSDFQGEVRGLIL